MAISPRRPGIARTMSTRARQQREQDPEGAPPHDPFSLVAGLRDLLGRAAGDLHKAVSQFGTQTVAIGDRDGRFVFGYSLRVGEARAEPFGHVDPFGPTPARDAPRQPIVDVFDEGEAIIVVAELPGVAAEAVTCRLDDGALLIEASGARRYRKRVDLPDAVLPDSLRSSVHNGILEARLLRAPLSP